MSMRTNKHWRLARAGMVATAATACTLGLALAGTPSPAAGPALADCGPGFLDNPAAPGQCFPIPGQPQETPSPGAPAGQDGAPTDPATGSDLQACDLNQPYLQTTCPGAPGAPIAPVVKPTDPATGTDLQACDLNQPYVQATCPGALPPP